jgi:phenylacetate-CoA ligase
VVLIGCQQHCFTYVSVTPTMDESGLAKINLHPADWRDPGDRARYLDALQAELWTGDPLAFDELLKLPVQARPRAILSTSMTLLPGCRMALEQRFGCPVLDLYSLNEAGPVAVADERSGGHVLLQHRLYVEIVDESGAPLPFGERGEVALTGGFNFCLPLVRYRTGDHAALQFVRGEPVLVGLAGRPPVRFKTKHGEWLNNIEVTHALKGFALAQWQLHQRHDGALHLRVAGAGAELPAVRAALLALFGRDQVLEVEPSLGAGDKVVQYTSDLAGAVR